ncbi:MAG: hypothetical protein C4524_08510 [Candidatus Zixiibacteriota bacterium]|nr:MAG: hypothetical protein C4524_08510 [candidate division Zixibacteria bacterium]
MKRALLIVLPLALLFLAGCGSDDSGTDPAPVTEPEYQSGTTGDDGSVSLNLGDYAVNVGVENQGGAGLSGMTVNAAVTGNYLICMAGDPQSDYYTDVQIVELGATSDGLNSTVTLSFALDGSMTGAQTLTQPPPFLAEIRDESGLVECHFTGTLVEIADTLEHYGDIGGIFHLGAQAAAALGVDVTTFTMTAAVLGGDINLFAVLLGEMTGIFDDDLITVYWYTNDDGNLLSPFYFDAVELHRDYRFKMTLTWGEEPRDLDAHLWTPEIEGISYHVYFGDLGSITMAPYAELDWDDQYSYGPENLTIDELYPGTYHFAIHHWTGEGTIATSGAQVNVYSETGLQHTLTVPTGNAGENWYWHVLDIDGTTGQITLINELAGDPPVAGYQPAAVKAAR